MNDDFKEPLEGLNRYRVRARNTAAESENRIHDDGVAARYGFRGGLVPGVTVYAYMTVPVVEREPAWLDRGGMRVRFQHPFYENELVTVISEVTEGGEGQSWRLRAEREDDTVCATAEIFLDGQALDFRGPRLDDFPPHPLPPMDSRPYAIPENLIAGTPLGSLDVKIDLPVMEQTYLRAVDERLPNYYGAGAVAHPGYLLGLANEIFVRNFNLNPWIHVGSEVRNLGLVRDGDSLSVRGRIQDSFERKGHEFVDLDILLLTDHARPVQQVRHRAIYKLRE